MSNPMMDPRRRARGGVPGWNPLDSLPPQGAAAPAFSMGGMPGGTPPMMPDQDRDFDFGVDTDRDGDGGRPAVTGIANALTHVQNPEAIEALQRAQAAQMARRDAIGGRFGDNGPSNARIR